MLYFASNLLFYHVCVILIKKQLNVVFWISKKPIEIKPHIWIGLDQKKIRIVIQTKTNRM